MIVQDVMSRDVHTVAPDTTIKEAARIMADADVGALPVAAGDRLAGMVHDGQAANLVLGHVSGDVADIFVFVAVEHVRGLITRDTPTRQTTSRSIIVLKARAFDTLVAPDDTSDGSNAADDGFVDALEDEADNPVRHELIAAINSLDIDAKITLVALAWLGRGDFDAAAWREALSTARERAEAPTARYLLGIPLLGDYLEDGADQLGINLITEHEDGLGDPDIDTRGGD